MEKSSGVVSVCVREEIVCVAGPRQWGDTRESWLSRVPREVKKVLGTATETVSFRTVKSLWHNEIKDREHHAARDIRRAAELKKARQEALALALQYQTVVGGLSATNKDLFGEEIARLERVARMLCGEDRP